jgi:hypothetical protein
MSAIISFLKYASKREISAISALTAATTPDLPSVVQTEFPYFTIEEMTMLLKLPNPQKYLGSRDLVLHNIFCIMRIFQTIISYLNKLATSSDTGISLVLLPLPCKRTFVGEPNLTSEIFVLQTSSARAAFHIKMIKQTFLKIIFYQERTKQIKVGIIRSLFYINKEM